MHMPARVLVDLALNVDRENFGAGVRKCSGNRCIAGAEFQATRAGAQASTEHAFHPSNSLDPKLSGRLNPLLGIPMRDLRRGVFLGQEFQFSQWESLLRWRRLEQCFFDSGAAYSPTLDSRLCPVGQTNWSGGLNASLE